jgi:hypothetical protein
MSLEEKNEWVFYKELELNDPKYNVFSIDTRDFHAGYRFEENSHPDFATIKKYPDFFNTENEIKELLDRYFTESGGKKEWRMFCVKGIGGWNMKYIRIWRTELGFVVCDKDNRAIKKEVLSNKAMSEF